MAITTVGIAGAGDVAKFFVEELEKDERFKIVVLSRAPREWFASRSTVQMKITDYTFDSLRPIVEDLDILFSFLHDNSSFYVNAHKAMLDACSASPRCKRFVPSEYGGDIDKYPDLPRFYKPTHGAFRVILNSDSHGVEWTLVNIGYFMDYFLPPAKTYMKPLTGIWPITGDDVIIPGTGDEPVGFTSARDVAKGLVKLVDAPSWDKHIYMCGERTTFNRAVEYLQQRRGRPYNISYRSAQEVADEIPAHVDDDDPKYLWKLYMDEWIYAGASAPPEHLVEQHRMQYFADVRFRGIAQLLDEEDLE
ncbi:NAD(P)-binding protein [Sistotremastrum suecicum HHB10207 ss-3]|uniref:NAD(P)-binding protein n=1 Tax=Sistotremastrum suecicum HHB10207 ss-3 TaxID=1314776 RepID=A0A166DUD5_9AGAM|nr:NAD(P)-binding protein [Sistotremastrum suecicum HHB10207 ss-3]